jgi:3-oxoacyl-[acyl-carrier-protein] synthase III
MYVPPRVLTNDDLAKTLDTSDEWIRSRTGIERRHIADGHETTAQMAIEAARVALQIADADPRDVDLIIVGTTTPDHPMPSTACQVQDALGASKAGAFDLNAGCSGFVYALTVGHQAIASGDHDLVLVIGADTLTRVVDWHDRSTCVLFGDGAGAVLLRAGDGSAGVMATILGSDGSGGELLQIPAGGSCLPATKDTVEKGLHYLQMNGREVFRFTTHVVPEAVEQLAAKSQISLQDIDLIIPHQANLRIIESIAKRLKLPPEMFMVNLQDYGNTSAASVPIALCEALMAGRIQPGHNIVMVGFGAGLTWAAALVKWGTSTKEAAPVFYHTWLRSLIYGWARARGLVRHILSRATVLLIRRADRRD